MDNGYLELEYLSADKSVALLNDGTNAWQILTEGAVIELLDGTTMNLSKGQLELPQTADGQTQPGFYVDDIEINVSRQNIWQNQNGYPVYRFTVLNGEDGAVGQDGASGEDGEVGEDGDEGEQGTDGNSEQSGAAGASGSSGSAGTIGEAGAGGGQMSGVSVSTTIPVVSLKSWSVNGKALKFTVYTDEVSCNSIVEGTTRISLFDTNTGKEVYYWDGDGDSGNTSQEGIDLSEDSADGFELYCNVLEPGHQYRLTVTAEYIVNDATGSQVLLTRNFTADDYGVSFELTDRTSNSFTYALKKTNQLVTVDSVEVYVDDVLYGTMTPDEFEDYTINLSQLAQGGELDHANQTYQISFRPRFEVRSFDENGDSTTVEVGADGSIRYDYTVTTLKNEPVLGGIRLTAYDSGYLMAEVLGKYEKGNSSNNDNGKYNAVSDPDETIQKIRFELYSDLGSLRDGTSPVATQESTSGYLAYFTVSESGDAPIKVGKEYYVRAYYTYSDGVKEMTLPVMETYGGTQDHPSESVAWDIAIPTSLVSTTMSFEGNNNLYNNPTEAADQTNQGISFNEISGNICASLSKSNRYIVSAEHPMELQISATPDYYQAVQYGGYNINSRQLEEVDASVSQPDVELFNYDTLKMQVDLTGLRANTAYMFTLYGYEKNGGSYNRVTMGSVAVSTRSSRYIELKMERDSADLDGVGVKLRLGPTDSSENYYDLDSGTYSNKESYRKNTAASYRGLNSITFELYREGTSTPLGTCRIENTSTSKRVDENSIYEEYFGTNAAKTFAKYKQANYKGIIGVGKDRYPYYFVNASNEPIQPGELTSGKYYIKASVAYDYTEMRYDYMSLNPDSALYNYYTYKAEQSEYINEITIMDNDDNKDTSEKIEAETLPYAEPSQLQMEDGSYVKVEPLTNDMLGAYNGDDDQNSLYSMNWDKDTVAGLQLTTKYMNDAELQTSELSFYGYTYTDWKNMNPQAEPTALVNGEEPYTVSCTLDLAANETQIIPKVWLLFYDEKDLPKLAAAATEPDKTGITEAASSEGKGCIYRKTLKDENIEIYYMKKANFARGKSYVFIFESKLPDYTYKDTNQNSHKGFNYPKNYYNNMESTVYTKSNALKSDVVSVNRQKPVVYSALQKTYMGGTDQWKVYVNDPDQAIHWNSILQTADNNHLPTGKNEAAVTGGIYDLYDVKLQSPISGSTEEDTAKYLTFEFGAQTGSETKTVDTRTVYNPEDENDPLTDEELLNSRTAGDLALIREMLSYRSMDETYEVTEQGGTIKVSNLPSDGVSYELLVDYLLLDDVGFDPANSYTNLPIIQHNYVGTNDYNDNDDKLQLAKAEAARRS